MTNIQTVIAPAIDTGSVYPAIDFQNVQTMALQTTTNNAWVAFSESDLLHENTRFKLAEFDTTSGDGHEGLVLTFPLKAYSGILWFASAGATGGANPQAEIHVWTITV